MSRMCGVGGVKGLFEKEEKEEENKKGTERPHLSFAPVFPLFFASCACRSWERFAATLVLHLDVCLTKS